MYTVSSILNDVDRGIVAHNMIENYFSYRVVYFINFENRSEKHYIDTRYDGLRETLENIIRRNLTTINTVVISAVTVRKNGESVSLLNRAYGFNLSEYFRQICEESMERNRSGKISYNRYAVR